MFGADEQALLLTGRMGIETEDLADGGDEAGEAEIVIASGVDGAEMANEEDGTMGCFSELGEAEKEVALARGGDVMQDGGEGVDDDERGVGTPDGTF
jgi:hypothetical protein